MVIFLFHLSVAKAKAFYADRILTNYEHEKRYYMRINEILTYKELCEELELSPKKSGRNRDLQLEKLKEEYDIEKLIDQRGKYIIHRELSKEEKQYIQDSKNYSNYIMNLLLNIFAQDKNSSCTFTLRELREQTGMVNSIYFPVKYHKAEVQIDKPPTYSGDINSTKQKWLGISDKMDEAIIKYALDKLKKKGVIEYYYTYKFYKIISQNEYQTIYYPPHVLTEDELSDFLQAQINALKKLGLDNKQQLHYCSEGQRAMYYGIMNRYILEQGYTNYARAITIIKPKELYKLVGYFSERFNKLQVQKYLKSKRFKTIPPFIHEQLIDRLIKT